MAGQKGMRIGAIAGTSDSVVEFFGYGTYEGEEMPPDDVYFMGLRYSNLGKTNPKLVMDDTGDVVWGCECWWGPEERIKKQMEAWKASGMEIKMINIQDYRAKAQEEATATA